jgi:hypothetical protein
MYFGVGVDNIFFSFDTTQERRGMGHPCLPNDLSTSLWPVTNIVFYS